MLINEVKVSSRFQRSIRIDSDVGDKELINSFVFPQSSIAILVNMANGYKNAKEAAFTWTGPYGSGKSSLVIALNALLGKNQDLKKLACKKISKEHANKITMGFNISQKKGWTFIPIVGQKSSAEKAIEKTLVNITNIKRQKSTETVLEYIDRISKSEECGLFIVIDEMGKFLEASAQGEFDIYFFQELAELASRSNGKIVILGILHQAFAEYAKRLSINIRDEWSKIQGRFIDLPLNVAGEELIELICKAIISDHKPLKVTKLSKNVANHIANWRPVNPQLLAKSLTMCWPLHPVTAALLGPISRRRFGQNQRSVFAFLNTSEPNGFQDFLRSTPISSNKLFLPYQLWDYLKSNLEPSIIASPDGHRWALALDSLARAEANGAKNNSLNLMKSLAILDLFQERSGLIPDKKLLSLCLPEISTNEIEKILLELHKWSILLYKKHKKAYSLYEGSDFDIESSIDEANEQLPELNYNILKKAAQFQPIVAKRHYLDTGALRWMNVVLIPFDQVLTYAENFEANSGSMGLFITVLKSDSISSQKLNTICKNASQINKKWPIIISVIENSSLINNLAREIQALEWIKENNPSLGGDTVARREVDTRLVAIKNRLEESLSQTITKARWYINGNSAKIFHNFELYALTSKMADELYNLSPIINSELLNRITPSRNSNSALKILLYSMVNNLGQDRLGIIGYPAEGGLFDTLILKSGIYNGKIFVEPNKKNDPCRISTLWEQTDKYITNNTRTINLLELHKLWKMPPFGLKNGLIPFFSLAYILSKTRNYAFYLEGVYRPNIDDLLVDYLMKSPVDIAMRKMDLSNIGKKVLIGVCNILNKFDHNQYELDKYSKPIEIARSLVASVFNLPPWVLRTNTLSRNTIKLREVVKNANDPNKVLFDDLPNIFKEHENEVIKGNIKPTINELNNCLVELNEAYPKLLESLNNILIKELQIENTDLLGIQEINSRAKNILHISGDFKLDAFAARLTNYKGTIEDIEGIASLALDKPPREWIDLDVNRAKLIIAEFAQKFNHVEAYSRIHNRKDFRQTVAFMVALNGRPKTYIHEFSIKETKLETIKKIENKIRKVFNGEIKGEYELILAALANIGAEIIEDSSLKKIKKAEVNK